MIEYTVFSKITDECLKIGFKLETNLAEVNCKNNPSALLDLMESLNRYSMMHPNIRVIERLMFHHRVAFRTVESIKQIMGKSDPVIYAFAKMGKCDIKCNIKWLVNALNEIQEYQPIQNILATGPPVIRLKSPLCNIAKPGETITFQVSTISAAEIRWVKLHEGQIEYIDHIRKQEFSTHLFSYETKITDQGIFYIEVKCLGSFQEQSQWINVGCEKEIIQNPFPDSITKSNAAESIQNQQTIIPYPESVHDSIKKPNGRKRLALLIGIMEYTRYESLRAPESDINDLHSVLLDLGFTVYCFGDLRKEDMTKVLKTFSNLCERNNTYVFFYFAGHGSQENMVDYLELNDRKISVPEVLNILISNGPKLISIFDMCRNNNANDIKEPTSKVLQATIPVVDNLILIMSTLPTHQSYETKVTKSECTSLIVKPLCDTLRESASKKSINLVMMDFITKCGNIYQRPTFHTTGITDIIGICSSVQKISPKIIWKHPKDENVMKSISISCFVFHNFINISNKFKPSTAEEQFIKVSKSKEVSLKHPSYLGKDKKINLFKVNNCGGSLNIAFYLSSTLIVRKYSISIIIPEEIIPFL